MEHDTLVVPIQPVLLVLPVAAFMGSVVTGDTGNAEPLGAQAKELMRAQWIATTLFTCIEWTKRGR